MEVLSKPRHSHTQVANPKISLSWHTVHVLEQRALKMVESDLWHHQGQRAGAAWLSGEEVPGAITFCGL